MALLACWKKYHAAVCAIVIADIDQYVDKAKVAAFKLAVHVYDTLADKSNLHSELQKMLAHLSFELDRILDHLEYAAENPDPTITDERIQFIHSVAEALGIVWAGYTPWILDLRPHDHAGNLLLPENCSIFDSRYRPVLQPV